MLTHLDIRNYALIDHVEISLTDGLTIITGETGAGKSIMLGALSLLTGSRADSKAVAGRDSKALVEAEFSGIPQSVEGLLLDNNIDLSDDGVLLIRRELSPAGRSRAFINDTPVNLSLLSDVAAMLIDIHTQNSNTTLADPSARLSILDSFAGNAQALADYHKAFSDYVEKRKAIKRLRETLEAGRQQRELLSFQVAQLDKLNPKEGELERIEREYETLSEADEIRERLSEAYSRLQGADGGAVDAIAESARLLEASGLNLSGEEEGSALATRLETLNIELKDVAETVADYLERVHADPSRLARLSARMNKLYEAERQFAIADSDSLFALHKRLREKLDGLDSGSGNLEALEREARVLAHTLKQKADILSASRAEAALRLASDIREAARPLGLPNFVFEIRLTPGKLSHEGQESVDFLCSFNRNRELQPLEAVASGGEMSRVMLALKSVAAGNAGLSTIVFDEIDTGVSGEIASQMGRMMRGLGRSMQVLAITHLPQVAAMGKTHFKVYKEDLGDRTVSRVRPLDKSAREMEIAGMLSGAEVNDAAVKNARVLINEMKE